MKLLNDEKLISELSESQAGVFSTADLRVALSDPHPAAFGRRMRRLIDRQVLSRFVRGFYVASDFDLSVLSQRIAPNSCISFETVLARHLIIGTKPVHRILATKIGRTRRYSNGDFHVEHVGQSSHLFFGFENIDGIRYADPEKAVLDTCYFHLRGRRFAFDIYSDINLQKLDMDRIKKYLRAYRNSKFVAFAEKVLRIT